MNKLLASILVISGLLSSAASYAETSGRGLYLGAFAGAGRSNGDEVSQTGTAYANRSVIYPTGEEYRLPVDVSGKLKDDNFGLGGVSVGYEWATVGMVKPALEFEALYLSGDQKANLKNKRDEVGISRIGNEPLPDETVYAGNHTFKDSFDMRSFALMVNGVLGFETGTMFTPYAGAGIGMAKVKMKNSRSAQTCKFYTDVNPTCSLEMSGNQVVNHFNSDDSDSDYVFAAQAKLGVRAEFTKNVSMFAEYRYLRLNSADYKFGRTAYDTHLETDPWKVKTDATDLHFGLVGVQYAF